jgi:hypothetical protein
MARSTQLGERIMKIVNARQNRTPVSATRLVLTSVLVLALILPLASLAGKPEVRLDDVTSAEYSAITATLESFYDALNVGEEFEFIKESFLTRDYFDPPELTAKNLDRAVWKAAFDNTIRGFAEQGLMTGLTVNTRILSIRRDGEHYVVSQSLDLISDKATVESVVETSDSLTRRVKRHPDTGEMITETGYIVRSLEQDIVLTIEDSEWKIASYHDGLRIMRMDTESVYGPLFLVWVEDLGPDTTPYGAMFTKIIPNERRPFNNLGITFSLEE